MGPTVRGLPSHPLSRTPSSRVEVDAFAVGERPQIEALTGAPAQIAVPGSAVGIGRGGLDQRREFGREGPGLLFERVWVQPALAQAGGRSLRSSACLRRFRDAGLGGKRIRAPSGRTKSPTKAAVATPLVTAGHFRRRMAEVFLEVALVDLGPRGEASARRVPGELLLPIAFGEIAASRW